MLKALCFRYATLIATILVLVAGGNCLAIESSDIADMDLESLLDNVVLAASKHKETLEETPANVFVITREMIENYGFRNIGEALGIVPGFYITDDYAFSQIGVRGISFFGDWNSRVMVLLDGKSMTEQYGGTSSIDVIGITIDQLDRIEVIKGPSSSLYGSNAFLGMVNLITRAPQKDTLIVGSRYFSKTEHGAIDYLLRYRMENGVTVISDGSFTDRRGSDLFFKELSDISDSSLFRLDANGYYQYYMDSSDFTGGISLEKNTLRNYSSRTRLEKGKFSLGIHLSSQDNGLPMSAWGSLFNRRENKFQERRHRLDLCYRNRLSFATDLEVNLSYNYYFWADNILYNYYSLESEPEYLPGPLWIDRERDRYVSAEAQMHTIFNPNHNLIWGGEIQFHSIDQQSGETDASGKNIVENVIPAPSRESRGRIYNLYIQDEYKINRFLHLVGGIHFNYYTYTTGRATPKGAIIVYPYKNAVYKLIVSRGFRSPTFYEMTFDDGYCYIGNPDLAPELITCFEFIAAHKFPYGISLDLAAHHSKIKNLIVQTTIDQSHPDHPGVDPYLEEVFQFRNSGRMKTTSIELNLRCSPAYIWSGFANITWQKLTVTEFGGGFIPNSPRWLANFGVNWQIIRNRLTWSAWANHQASVYTADGCRLEDRTLVHSTLRLRSLWGGLNVSLGINNLLDRRYSVPLGQDYYPSTAIEQSGRSLSIRLDTGLGL